MAKQQAYTQPLCTVRIKTTQINSNVLLKHVTPAELMYLIADNHRNVGGDPIVGDILVESEEAEQAQLEKLQKEKADKEAELVRLDAAELAEEIREKRESALQQKIRICEDAIGGLAYLALVRSLGPMDERIRLSKKYPANKLAKFYPGQVPSLPQTFEEARRHGTKMVTGGTPGDDSLFTVGLEA